INEIISSNSQINARMATKKKVTMTTHSLNMACGESTCPDRRLAAPTPVMITPTIKSEMLKR
ncbi:MAG: hypothetical protein VZQ98_18855, partial [Bacteroidales bacterium]|nr:hypothetical protein [Bacteroidales bacterium]